jgi:hypothetical protein
MRAVPNVTKRDSGKIPSTAVTNELAEAVMSLLPQQDAGQHFPNVILSPPFMGVIVAAGPNSEADFTNEQYWVSHAAIDSLESTSSNVATGHTHITSSDTYPERIVSATNRAEHYLDVEHGGVTAYQTGTHLLPVGRRVFVFESTDGVGNSRFHFFHQPKIVARVVGNEPCGGLYNGFFVVGATNDLDPEASTFAHTDIGATGAACLIMNAAEEGLTTHYLTQGGGVSRVFPGWVRSRKSNDDKHVVIINGYDFELCEEEP